MRINVLQAGPAGLYVAILLKRADPRREILVVEREADWDVALTEELAEVMRAADYASYRAIADAPARLLPILRRRCAEVGVDVAYGHEVVDPATLVDADLLVGGADAGASNVALVGATAIEDAIALAGAFARHRDVAPALAAYEDARCTATAGRG